MIKLTNVSFKYDNGVHALYNVNLEINDGEFVYITGTTGSGKSTLIKLLDTEIVPTKGTVMVNDINVGKLRRGKVPGAISTDPCIVCISMFRFFSFANFLSILG